MVRFRLFLTYQLMAFRALLRRDRPAIFDLPQPDFDKTAPACPIALRAAA